MRFYVTCLPEVVCLRKFCWTAAVKPLTHARPTHLRLQISASTKTRLKARSCAAQAPFSRT
jgi:hypothetical protein